MRLFVTALVGLALLAQALQQKAAKLFEERKYAESAELLEKHLRDHPADFAAHMLLGLSLQQLGELGRAEASLAAAIRLQPANGRAYYSLARVRFLLGRFDEALKAADQAQKLGEPAARVHNLRGRIEEERGRFNVALEEYRRAIQADRTMVDALAGEASVLYKLATPKRVPRRKPPFD